MSVDPRWDALRSEVVAARRRSGMTLAAAAKKLGMGKSTLERFENDPVRHPRVDILIAYAGLFGYTVTLRPTDPAAPSAIDTAEWWRLVGSNGWRRKVGVVGHLVPAGGDTTWCGIAVTDEWCRAGEGLRRCTRCFTFSSPPSNGIKWRSAAQARGIAGGRRG